MAVWWLDCKLDPREDVGNVLNYCEILNIVYPISTVLSLAY